jgi:hypothetical protein
LRYTTTPPAAVTTRLTAFLNETHREVLALPGMAFLREDVMPITAIANLSRTGLPPTVARISAITDRSNNFRLEQVPLSQLRSTDPAQSSTGGYPMRYAVVGNQAVIRQPATTGLWVVSSSASDTTQKAYVESVTTGGYPNNYISAGSSVNGTTRVAIGARTDHIEVTRFYVDLVGVGFLSLYDAAVAGNELARIPIGQTFSRHQAVEWFPIQTADVTEYLDYQRTIFDLVNGTDEPLLPTDLHPILAIGARVKEYELLEDDRGLLARADYEREKAALRSYVLNNPDRIASLRADAGPRGSSLGASYPAGS